MRMDRYKRQHVGVIKTIKQHARAYSQHGIALHAGGIAAEVVALHTNVMLYLSPEDRVLYPTMDRMHDESISNRARILHDEMSELAARCISFSRRCMRASATGAHPENCRADANLILRALHKRIQQESLHFYPRLEASSLARGDLRPRLA